MFQGLYSFRVLGISKEDQGLYIIRCEEDVVVAGSFQKEVISVAL